MTEWRAPFFFHEPRDTSSPGIRPGSCGNKNGVTFFYPKEKLAWKEREGGLALLRFKGIPRGYIVLSTHVRENSRRRFTLAHEVGHYVLPDQQELCQPCTKMQIESWEDDLSKPEIAANRFSAEILMPRSLVRLEDMPTFESIKELARACDTSLTASASRLAELSSFRVAAVWSQGGRVRWYKGSEGYCQVDVERANLSRRADFLCSHRTAQVTSCQTMKARSRSSR